MRKARALGWFVCFLGALFYCYEYLLRVSPSVMSTQLMSFYHLSAEEFGNLSSYYYYIYVPLQLFVGLLFDRYGPKKLMTMAVVCCSAGIFVFASTHHLWLADTGRFLMGFGSAFAFVGVLKLATIWLPPNRFGLVSGLALALGMTGGLVGDLALTSLVSHMGWRETCYLAAGFGVILTLLVGFIVKDKNPDIPEEVQQVKIHSVVTAWPQLVRVLTNPQLWVNGLIGCLMYMPLSAFAEIWAIPFLKEGYHFSATAAASGSSVIFLGWLVGGPAMGALSDFIGRRRVVITLGTFISAILICVVLYVPGVHISWVYPLLFFFGIFSSPQVLVFPIGREISSPLLTGTALALTNMVVMVSGFIVPFVGLMLDLTWSGKLSAHGVHVYNMHSFQVGLSVLPIGLVLAGVLSLFLKETYCKPVSE